MRRKFSGKAMAYVLVMGMTFTSFTACGKKKSVEETTETTEEITTEITIEETTEATTEEERPKVKNPIDFDEWWQQDKNVYAYIEIPNTRISEPILQSDDEQEEDYYLEHNLDGSSGYPGCIYTQRLNDKDFDDYNTVIYGHNMKNGDGFRDLHEFRDTDFFDENKYIYIYTPDEMLTYEIFGAYVFTDAHILNTNDFSTVSGYKDYLDMVKDWGQGNYRDVESLTTDDRIITLSTCTNYDTERYLVQAKLVDRVGTY